MNGPETWKGGPWVDTLKNMETAGFCEPSGPAGAARSFLLETNAPVY